MARYPKPPFYELWRCMSPQEKQRLVAATGLDFTYLSRIANGHRRPGIDAVTRLEKADKRITRECLRPDLE